jgi:hypothetical protein
LVFTAATGACGRAFRLLEASDGLTVQSRNEPDGYGFRTLTGDGEPEVGEHFPVFALNFVLATPGERWALRYPDTDELWVLERQAGGARGWRHLDQTSQYGTLRVRSTDPAACESVVLATERMDEHPIWRLLEPGGFCACRGCSSGSSIIPVAAEPAHRLTLEQLDTRTAASQTAERSQAPVDRRA